jgi:hypothetical protein
LTNKRYLTFVTPQNQTVWHDRAPPPPKPSQARGSLEFRGVPYTVGFSRFDDGSLAEVFIDNHKCTSDLSSDARDAAVALSISLQHGVPPEAIRDAVTRDANGEASGILGCVLDLLTVVYLDEVTQ